MKQKMTVTVVAMTLALCIALIGQGSAITLELPDINFDSSQGAGQNLFASQPGVHFDAGMGFLTVSAAAVSISFNGTTFTPLVDGTLDYRVKLTSFAGGIWTQGNFGTDMVEGNDLVLADSTANLLTGDFESYTVLGLQGTRLAFGDAVFSVTGGSLADHFLGGTGGIVHLEFNLSTPPGLTFEQSWQGQVSGDLAPVLSVHTPEPGTMFLLGTGLLAMAGYGWRRQTQ